MISGILESLLLLGLVFLSIFVIFLVFHIKSHRQKKFQYVHVSAERIIEDGDDGISICIMLSSLQRLKVSAITTYAQCFLISIA